MHIDGGAHDLEMNGRVGFCLKPMLEKLMRRDKRYSNYQGGTQNMSGIAFNFWDMELSIRPFFVPCVGQ